GIGYLLRFRDAPHRLCPLTPVPTRTPGPRLRTYPPGTGGRILVTCPARFRVRERHDDSIADPVVARQTGGRRPPERRKHRRHADARLALTARRRAAERARPRRPRRPRLSGTRASPGCASHCPTRCCSPVRDA